MCEKRLFSQCVIFHTNKEPNGYTSNELTAVQISKKEKRQHHWQRFITLDLRVLRLSYSCSNIKHTDLNHKILQCFFHVCIQINIVNSYKYVLVNNNCFSFVGLALCQTKT